MRLKRGQHQARTRAPGEQQAADREVGSRVSPLCFSVCASFSASLWLLDPPTVEGFWQVPQRIALTGLLGPHHIVSAAVRVGGWGGPGVASLGGAAGVCRLGSPRAAIP